MGHERLARFVPARDYDPEEGTIKPTLFAHAGRTGMSVTRVDHSSPKSLADQQSSKAYIGYVVARCEDVRGISHEGEQVFAVYDTAIPENTAHADVCQSVFGSDSMASKLRRQLQKAFRSQLLNAQQDV